MAAANKNKQIMKKIIYIISLLFLIVSCEKSPQSGALKHKIEQIISTEKAEIGVSVIGIEDNDTLSINNSKHFPMQSVFKFHVALTVLNQVDKGMLSLDQKIDIKKSDLLLNTWSPIREQYPDGNINLTLAEIINFTVSQSDNIGCDILLRHIGGTKKVNDYIHNVGVKNVAIVANEEEMHKGWNVQFNNWTTPSAASELLKKFYSGKILSDSSFEFLWKVMLETVSGGYRIKGQLPVGTLVAHKTGTSDTNEQGVTAAVNDIGIVTLPNGKHFAICVFVSNSQEDYDTNEKVIADIAKLTWDYFLDKAN